MNEKRGLLVAIDGSPAAEDAIKYVGTMMAGQPSVEVHLLHVLPPMPPRLREHGGASSATEEQALGAKLELERNDWEREQISHSQPLFEQAEFVLAEAGLATSMMEEECRLATDSEQLSEICLKTARNAGCNTLVVGRESFSWLGERWHQHLCHEIVRRGEGFAVWVVCT
ncbi:MAG: universal stress protein [Acidimicrobiia bacterium]|nr:universal stress protein [Acidimicrobiia bacterium]MDX2465991.1 universal stress protein [Acidimicrobiia bacterium]